MSQVQVYEVIHHSITCAPCKGLNPDSSEEIKRHWHKGSLIELTDKFEIQQLLKHGAIKTQGSPEQEQSAKK